MTPYPPSSGSQGLAVQKSLSTDPGGYLYGMTMLTDRATGALAAASSPCPWGDTHGLDIEPSGESDFGKHDAGRMQPLPGETTGIEAQHIAAHLVAQFYLDAVLTWNDNIGFRWANSDDGDADPMAVAKVMMCGAAVENRHAQEDVETLFGRWQEVVDMGDVESDVYWAMTIGLAREAFVYAELFVEGNWPQIEKVAALYSTTPDLTVTDVGRILSKS